MRKLINGLFAAMVVFYGMDIGLVGAYILQFAYVSDYACYVSAGFLLLWLICLFFARKMTHLQNTILCAFTICNLCIIVWILPVVFHFWGYFMLIWMVPFLAAAAPAGILILFQSSAGAYQNLLFAIYTLVFAAGLVWCLIARRKLKNE